MNVPSLQFLAFAAVAAALVNASPQLAWRRGVLLVANVAFFLTFGHDLHRLGPFLFLLALGFAMLKAMEARKGSVSLALGAGALLVTFFWLKQYAFVPHHLLLPFAYATVGMSYVFFRILALVIDAAQGALEERVGIVSYLTTR